MCSLQRIFCVLHTKQTNKKVKHKNFLHEDGRLWISEVQNRSASSSDDFQLPEKQTQRGPEQDPPGKFSRNLRIYKLEKMFAGGEGKNKYPVRQHKVCAAHNE
jgi:hypothetical protein